MLKINVDYSEEAHHDQLVRNAHLQLCLSVMNHLGFKGEFQPRTFAGKFAMLALNVRNIVILITIASNTPINLKEKLSPLDEPGMQFPYLMKHSSFAGSLQLLMTGCRGCGCSCGMCKMGSGSAIVAYGLSLQSARRPKVHGSPESSPLFGDYVLSSLKEGCLSTLAPLLFYPWLPFSIL